METKRGHRLGRIIREGAAIPNTGIPGVIGGYGAERVIHAQAAGIFKNVRVIGDIVEAGDTIAEIWQEDGTKLLVQTQITGILRGLLRDVSTESLTDCPPFSDSVSDTVTTGFSYDKSLYTSAATTAPASGATINTHTCESA